MPGIISWFLLVGIIYFWQAILGYFVIVFGGLFAWDYAYQHGMVGTSANLVEIHDFAIITSNKIGVLPRVTGTLVNNSNNRLITFRYTLKFYQCPILKYDRSNVNGCKEVHPEEISATNNMYELHIGVDPHSHAIFDEQMITYLGNLYSSYNRYDTYVTVRPVIYHVYEQNEFK